ncbi:hypothetical protein [Paucibacter sp. B51]|uniref:hypothetical protein n=1 Tax=Paucibacter sp. B51 TaxID=2993315 RepID=UPI0022EBCD16|nr:hypothetical protein [Paucibacter sp. B51]
MNTWIGSALALVALVGGGLVYGWQGVILALTVVVFWLLLQFSRLMRVMRAASEAPIGRVESAVMLNAKLRAGMKLVDVLPLTRSLGQKISEQPEVYGWTDAGGVRVELHMEGGTVRSWSLLRPEDAPKEQQAS